MLNERKLSVEQMKTLKAHLHRSVVFKHSDRAQVGLPDTSISLVGRTFWNENKFQRHGDKLKDLVGSDQLVQCHELWLATGGRAWVTVYSEDRGNGHVTVWQPRALAAHIFPRVILGDTTGCQPARISQDGESLFQTLNTIGAICSIDGYDHMMLVRLIRSAL